MYLIIGIIYGLGYLVTFRYVMGYFLSEVACDPVDAFDFFFSTAASLIVTAAWPIVVAGRGLYVLGVKYGPADDEWWKGIFPAPKEVESRYERNKRLRREKEAELTRRERWVREREMELR